MSFTTRAFLTAALSLSVSGSAVAADSIRLSHLAAASGYTYGWLATEGGVSLQRPGVVIVLHAGYRLYEVNATPVQADSAPRFERGDLIVSPALALRLTQIALAHPQAHSPAVMPALPLSPRSAIDGATAPATGTLTITARQIPGQEALLISGTAPAGVPVTITLTGEPSVDLPTLTLSRTTVIAAGDGTFSTVASIGQDPHRGTKIAAIATSFIGVGSATTRIVVGAPSPGVLHSSFDEFPPK